MRYAMVLLLLLLVLATTLQSQNITNTLGPEGFFSVKYSTTTFLSVSAGTGHLQLTRSLMLPATTASNLGVIYKGTSSFLHDFQATGTTGQNTFLGINAGNLTMSGSLNEASENTGVGYACLGALTTGFYNSAFGHQALTAATTAYANAAFGDYALFLNTSGTGNSAFGMNSLKSTNTNSNSAFGYAALQTDTSGSNNSAFGHDALFYNVSGSYNSAFGKSAGMNITTGSNNTCIGYNAQVPSSTTSNQVQIGDANITYAGVQVAWTITSDRRLKSGIVPSDLGLDFVSHLKPVSYVRNNDKTGKKEYGFIAQEVENALQDAGAKKPGMITVDDKGTYELRYNDLIAPMVKAIQDLKAENDMLKARLSRLEHLQQTSAKLSGNVRDDKETTLTQPRGGE